ncbi:MAG: hypothetical protein WD847_10655 [Pirellulales bacterium]
MALYRLENVQNGSVGRSPFFFGAAFCIPVAVLFHLPFEDAGGVAVLELDLQAQLASGYGLELDGVELVSGGGVAGCK